MDPSEKRRLKILFLRIALLMMLFFFIAWRLPPFVSHLLMERIPTKDSASPQKDFDIEALLEELDIPPPLNEDKYKKVKYATFCE